ncbi:MAG: hypothetical protein EA359_09630 [Balneolaceae bacterium]|nr:MAG: hypothetical protein EA359_09630 [Balneolaceae bacterium]
MYDLRSGCWMLDAGSTTCQHPPDLTALGGLAMGCRILDQPDSAIWCRTGIIPVILNDTFFEIPVRSLYKTSSIATDQPIKNCRLFILIL